ncbi:MAG TPA: response regulator, partial [Dysgonamonadaceae bacterium]|nr:response regulator [Dysgonamonadaceae bacterium]
MKKTRFLWVDDEIELMKPYRLFLEEKGYELESANNGRDAVDLCRNEHFDMIFLDEHMPGISGLETLSQIAMIRPDRAIPRRRCSP